MNTYEKILYDYTVGKLITDEFIVTLTPTDIANLDEFVKAVMVRKKAEKHHQTDPFNEAKRWRTGMGGEIALEIFLNKKFVDFSVGDSVGDSASYHTPDLSKLNLKIGIKTVERGKYPVIFKQSSKPETIILRLDDERFCILGLATADDLNKFQDDNEILSPALRARGTKTAFIGLDKLKRFKSYQELIKIIW